MKVQDYLRALACAAKDSQKEQFTGPSRYGRKNILELLVAGISLLVPLSRGAVPVSEPPLRLPWCRNRGCPTPSLGFPAGEWKVKSARLVPCKPRSLFRLGVCRRVIALAQRQVLFLVPSHYHAELSDMTLRVQARVTFTVSLCLSLRTCVSMLKKTWMFKCQKRRLTVVGWTSLWYKGVYTAVTSERAVHVEVGPGLVAHLGFRQDVASLLLRVSLPTKKGPLVFIKALKHCGSHASLLKYQLQLVVCSRGLWEQADKHTRLAGRRAGAGGPGPAAARPSVRPGGHVGVRKRQSEGLSALDFCFIYLFFLRQIPSAGFCGFEAGYK